MAVVLPGKFIFLAHPHTASSSMVLAFQDAFPEAFDIRPHHMRLEELKGPNGKTRVQQISKQRTRIYDSRPHKNLTDYPEGFLTGDEIVFTVVRNPYDYFTSRYVRVSAKEPFASFARNYRGKPYIEKDKIFYHVPDCDNVLRYENLQEELNQLMAELELSEVPLGKHNVTKGKEPWESYYSPEAFAAVNERFGGEISPFYKTRTS
jgi:hypothetical protein